MNQAAELEFCAIYLGLTVQRSMDGLENLDFPRFSHEKKGWNLNMRPKTTPLQTWNSIVEHTQMIGFDQGHDLGT